LARRSRGKGRCAAWQRSVNESLRSTGYAASWEALGVAMGSISFEERGGAASGLLSLTNPASHKASMVRRISLGMKALSFNNIVVVPVRSGVGLRLGANVGYLKFTPTSTWNPF
jgi:Envelope integrity protein A